MLQLGGCVGENNPNAHIRRTEKGCNNALKQIKLLQGTYSHFGVFDEFNSLDFGPSYI